MENADSTSTNSSEWMVVKLEADGSLQWQWQVNRMPGDTIAVHEYHKNIMIA